MFEAIAMLTAVAIGYVALTLFWPRNWSDEIKPNPSPCPTTQRQRATIRAKTPYEADMCQRKGPSHE